METELARHIVSGCIVVGAWIIISAFWIAIICMNSSRLSRLDEPFLDPAQIARKKKDE